MNLTNNSTRFNRRAFVTATGAAIFGGSASAASLPEVHKAVSEEIMGHVRALVSILNREAPEGVTVNGLQFRALEGDLLEDTVWASARGDDLSIWNMRPAYYDGWKKFREAV